MAAFLFVKPRTVVAPVRRGGKQSSCAHGQDNRLRAFLSLTLSFAKAPEAERDYLSNLREMR
jgi:hypothetical protein